MPREEKGGVGWELGAGGWEEEAWRTVGDHSWKDALRS